MLNKKIELFEKYCKEYYQLYIASDDYKSTNNAEKKMSNVVESLILEDEGPKALYDLMKKSEDDVILYELASILICLYPSESIAILKK